MLLARPVHQILVHRRVMVYAYSLIEWPPFPAWNHKCKAQMLSEIDQSLHAAVGQWISRFLFEYVEEIPCFTSSDCPDSQCCLSLRRPIGKRDTEEALGHCKMVGQLGEGMSYPHTTLLLQSVTAAGWVSSSACFQRVLTQKNDQLTDILDLDWRQRDLTSHDCV